MQTNPMAARPPVAMPQPLAVSPRVASRLLSLGNTRLYQLIRSGELASYVDGQRARRITMASIKKYVARQLHEQNKGDGNRRYASSPHPRGRPRKRTTERPQIELRT
jgi:excisionase family DNA binding protein